MFDLVSPYDDASLGAPWYHCDAEPSDGKPGTRPVGARARTSAAQLGLRTVEVRTTDAGVTDPYTDIAPAHVVLGCGVFGNTTTEHIKRTIATLPRLLTHCGIAIWTRGSRHDGTDPSLSIRTWFADHGHWLAAAWVITCAAAECLQGGASTCTVVSQPRTCVILPKAS